MLYALGLGYGSEPTDPTQLAFVYEDDLRAVPSMCCVLAHPGMWVRNPDFGIDWLKMLHGEQSFEIHNPLPPEGTVVGSYEIVAVEDKGAGKGAILHQVKKLRDTSSGQLLATVRSVLFMRGDGGCGSFGEVPEAPQPVPEQAPSSTCEIATLAQSALIYRLSGDYNPIHADPKAAAKAGFEAPILHGLCTFGVATRALLTTFAKGAPERLKSLSVRFSRPVYPGETIKTEFFGAGSEIRFRSRVVERDLVVLDRGSAVFAS
ncbi:MAG: MaoC family dehydratase N-terminal domain-containing protein [Rhizobiales bacterium]|nr:MaoC family dehydratase N-terminal domain-containing protein [Hyphomicrobiales bacterium]